MPPICPVARPHRPPVIIANSVDAQEASCVEIRVNNSIYIVNTVLTSALLAEILHLNNIHETGLFGPYKYAVDKLNLLVTFYLHSKTDCIALK